MVRKIHWGDLAVPFTFSCLVASGHFGLIPFALAMGMILVSYILSFTRPFKDDEFPFFSPLLHFIAFFGVAGLIAFFIKIWWINLVLSFIGGIVIEIMERWKQLRYKKLPEWRYLKLDLDTFLDLIFDLAGIILFLWLKHIF